MATSATWKLKVYGRFVSKSGKRASNPWKKFEANGKKPEIFLTVVESGYLLVLQGHKSLDTIPLHCGSDIVEVHQKSDTLMLRFTVKGEGRMIRMQFDGSSVAEAINRCSSAVQKLMEYTSVTIQSDTLPPSNQSPTEVSAPEMQEKAVRVEPEVVQGSLSVKHLTQYLLELSQHFLGETAVTLPQVYRQDSLAQSDLEPILRVCLLDPTFHAFVEKVEGELRKVLGE
uniref:meiotic recombination protein REC114 n=1 Tax=Scatophagus argus TaxID=75038 RepID=UPI001ED8284D|nr:meiotic recombination protein REC114 [Scatophagus argus]